MDHNEAAAALASAGRIEQKLAERAHWPFHRHAMFGLAEGLIVAGVAQPLPMSGAMIGVAMSLVALCVLDDRRRHGMFIPGWQAGATRPITLALSLFVLVMAVLAFTLRDGESVKPLGYLLGAGTFVICTAASLLWERIYRAQLSGGRRS